MDGSGASPRFATMFPAMAGTLEIPKRARPAVNVLTAILRDVQFWIPVVVLAAGLILLAAIQ